MFISTLMYIVHLNHEKLRSQLKRQFFHQGEKTSHIGDGNGRNFKHCDKSLDNAAAVFDELYLCFNFKSHLQ